MKQRSAWVDVLALMFLQADGDIEAEIRATEPADAEIVGLTINGTSESFFPLDVVTEALLIVIQADDPAALKDELRAWAFKGPTS